ncbi:MAG TPA: hypothetical protein VG269_25005 [Tepidisphaeraceae bacterium]|jgi:hypothetical protein|nr:hypothetical protein [Tepidisphaeraceae bacterium]
MAATKHPTADMGTSSGDTYGFACAINDTGWVIGDSGGHSMLQDGTFSQADQQFHAVRLDLVPSPEPSSRVALCAEGTGVLLRRKRA